MFELVYHSRSFKDLSDKDLDDILVVARQVNQEKNITGMLIYCQHQFFQLLEGDQRDVIDVFDKIARDKRHTDISTLYQGSIESRSFDNWSMAFRRFNNESELPVDGFVELEKAQLNQAHTHENESIAKRLFTILSQHISQH